jgi:hypothetical protein
MINADSFNSDNNASSMSEMTYDEIQMVSGGHNSKTQCPAAGHTHTPWEDLKELAPEVWGWFF